MPGIEEAISKLSIWNQETKEECSLNRNRMKNEKSEQRPKESQRKQFIDENSRDGLGVGGKP